MIRCAIYAVFGEMRCTITGHLGPGGLIAPELMRSEFPWPVKMRLLAFVLETASSLVLKSRLSNIYATPLSGGLSFKVLIFFYSLQESTRRTLLLKTR